MNLRIADSARLVAFLHRVIADEGRVVLATPRMAIVRVGDVVFSHANDPLSVGGPFASVEMLLRSEGVRRHPVAGSVTEVDDPIEILEWAGGFFRMEGSRMEPIGPFENLREALDVEEGDSHGQRDP